VQVPRLPTSAHEVHVPVQLDVQQTPCWHCPEAHSTPVVHTVPGVFLAHWPMMQTLGATQSASAVQDPRQVPFVPHWYGSQGTAVDAAWHVPVPLHVCGGVYEACEQLPPTQVVPLAYSRQPPAPSHIPSVPQLGAP
jgi:hypothetical protein